MLSVWVGMSGPTLGEDVGDARKPAAVEGVTGERRVEPHLLGQPFSAALLSPLDRPSLTASGSLSGHGSSSGRVLTDPGFLAGHLMIC